MPATLHHPYRLQRLPPGVGTWPKDKPVPARLQPLAAEVFAFDVLTQNPDRRRDNALTKGAVTG